MKHLKIFLAVVLLTVAGLQLQAQTKPAVVKFKPPKLVTSLGNLHDSVAISVEQASSIIDKALSITDDKNIVYKISSYQFLYRKRGVTEDEGTGKVSPVTSIVSQLFKVTPLPKTWVDNIQQQLQAGEELFFFDVIAKDATGRVMYAPNLKIVIR